MVTNTGDQPLAEVELSDDRLAASAVSCGSLHDDTNGDRLIDLMFPGDVVTCTASITVDTIGSYRNIAEVVGVPVTPTACVCVPGDFATWPTDPDAYEPVTDDAGNELGAATDSDPSHHWGVGTAIDIEKATNGDDADTTDGPWLADGDAVVWTLSLIHI